MEIRPKMVKLWRNKVEDDYEVRWNDGLIVGPMIQKEVVVLRKPTHHPT